MVLQVSKRGRKKKIVSSEENIHVQIDEILNISNDTPVQPENVVALKKRGRKPKGGKLIIKPVEEIEVIAPLPNVILHLKCCLKDLTDYNYKISEMVKDPLTYNPAVPPDIMTYNDSKTTHFAMYESKNNNNNNNNNTISENSTHTSFVPDTCYAYNEFICKKCNVDANNSHLNPCSEKTLDDDDESINIKDVNTKLKRLRIQYFKNSLQDKKSSCFWCTYDFDNETCYIPKYDTDDGTICGYGSFCRPECAVAFLMKENIDDSTKFKRYEMLNRIYSKVYDFKKNIKPAADPHYLLEKFYGSLSIKEYRKLSKSEHMLLIVDKPMTRILPELHEDNDEFILNIYGGIKAPQNNGQSGVYKVKRQSEKNQGPTKNSIIQKKFGVSN